MNSIKGEKPEIYECYIRGAYVLLIYEENNRTQKSCAWSYLKGLSHDN